MSNTKDPVKATIEWYSHSTDAYRNARSSLERDKENREYFLEHIPGKKILDIWCAHGRDVCEFFKRWIDITGIDLTPEFVEMAKASCPHANIQVMDMRDLTFESNTFDGIWACASLLHIPKRETKKTIEWFHRVLKKWWLLFICVMEGDGEGYDKRAKYNNTERFFSYWQKDQLEQKIKDNNFSIQKSFVNQPGDSNSNRVNIFAIAE
jgi:SAM-dependent methyltransferase